MVGVGWVWVVGVGGAGEGEVGKTIIWRELQRADKQGGPVLLRECLKWGPKTHSRRRTGPPCKNVLFARGVRLEMPNPTSTTASMSNCAHGTHTMTWGWMER